jgi:ERCC4-type nuclease
MNFKYKFTDTEIKRLLKENVMVIVDTREQQNQHILDFFKSQNIKYESKKLDSGDYSIKLLSDLTAGIPRDLYCNVSIEKKNSVDELASSFKERTRFEAEFIRATGNGTRMYLLVEEANGYENILQGKYRSLYDKKALLASLKSFECRYNFGTTFLAKQYSGDFIYRTLLYYLREVLIN